MKNTEIQKEEEWQLLILKLKKIAKKVLGVGYQKQISVKTSLNKNQVSRFFRLQYIPKISTFFKINKVLDEDLIMINANELKSLVDDLIKEILNIEHFSLDVKDKNLGIDEQINAFIEQIKLFS